VATKFEDFEVWKNALVDTDEAIRMISGFIEYLNTSTIKGNKFKNRSNVKN